MCSVIPQTTKILYEIWRSTPDLCYRLERVISVIPYLSRRDIISLSQDKLLATAKYLDDISPEDVKHHVIVRNDTRFI